MFLNKEAENRKGATLMRLLLCCRNKEIHVIGELRMFLN